MAFLLKIMVNKRKMPNKNEIIQTWKPFFKEQGIDIKNECFACSFPVFLERSHIVAKTYGGTDAPENIHLLCKFCHLESEFLENSVDYFKWIFSKSKENSLAWKFVANISNLNSFIGLSDLEIIRKVDTIKKERIRKKLNERKAVSGEWRKCNLTKEGMKKGVDAIRKSYFENDNIIFSFQMLKKFDKENPNSTLIKAADFLNSMGCKTKKGSSIETINIHRWRKILQKQEQEQNK
jgi:hypothetical protein